jgi:GxxExxY protein
MHPKYKEADRLSHEVIGAAIEVHRHLGPGLHETIYEKCLMRELELRGIPAENQVPVNIEYKGKVFEEALRLDVLVGKCLALEMKAIEDVLPIHKAILMSYMKLTGSPVGLMMNFHVPMMTQGINRFILPGANLE